MGSHVNVMFRLRCHTSAPLGSPHEMQVLMQDRRHTTYFGILLFRERPHYEHWFSGHKTPFIFWKNLCRCVCMQEGHKNLLCLLANKVTLPLYRSPHESDSCSLKALCSTCVCNGCSDPGWFGGLPATSPRDHLPSSQDAPDQTGPGLVSQCWPQPQGFQVIYTLGFYVSSLILVDTALSMH